MEHKQDKYIGTYWVGACRVDVSVVWRGWDYRTGHEYCKREDYTEDDEHSTHIYYDNAVVEVEYDKLCRTLEDEVARHNYD